MASRRRRVGIVGCTGIASSPVGGNGARSITRPMPQSHASAYALFPEIEVVAVCDLVAERTAEFVNLWGERWNGIRRHDDFRRMLDEHELDILSVVTSDHRHAEIVVAAAEAGIPAVFCEKPLATTLEDADRMIEACEKSGTILSVDHTRRWHPLYLRAREIVRSGELGEIGLITGILGGSRAMLFRNGTHCIDAICHFAESEPVWVWAVNDPDYADYHAYAGDGGRTAEREPGVLGFIEFENGRRAFYEGTKRSIGDFGAEIVGTKGRLSVRDHRLTLYRSNTNAVEIPWEAHVYERWAGAVEELLRLIQFGGEPVSSGREARKTVAVTLGFLESQKRGNAKVFLSRA